MKPKFKIVYPVKLGKERENELIGPIKKKKKKVKTDTKIENLINDINISEGRWVDTNYEDWSNPNWEKIKNVCGVVIDRALGGNNFSETKRDLAIYTEYEDPNSQMIVFDLVPIESSIFDMDKEPSKNLNEVYQFEAGRGPQSRGIINYGFEYDKEFPSTIMMLGTMFATVIVVSLSVMGEDK